MNFNRLNRNIHYWVSMVIALPLLMILVSGSMLQLKKQIDWVQPPEQRGTKTSTLVDLEDILTSVQALPKLGVTGWPDIDRLDVRPGKGIVKVRLKTGWEAQVDLGTGHVLQTAYRRSDLIESIHDGSFFAGNWTKLGLFLPTVICLLLVWGTGVWMLRQPFSTKHQRTKATGKPLEKVTPLQHRMKTSARS